MVPRAVSHLGGTHDCRSQPPPILLARRSAWLGAVAARVPDGAGDRRRRRREPGAAGRPQGESHGPKDRDKRRGARAAVRQQRALAAQEPDAEVQWNAARHAGVGEQRERHPRRGTAPANAVRGRPGVGRTRTVRLLGSLRAVGRRPRTDLQRANRGRPGRALPANGSATCPAGHDGLLSVGVRGDAVVFVSSSLARDGAPPGPATVSAADAVSTAAADAGRPVSADDDRCARHGG